MRISRTQSASFLAAVAVFLAGSSSFGALLSISSVTPSFGSVGASVPVAVAGSSFDVTGVLTLERASPASGVWTTTGSFTQARMLGTLTKLADGRVLLAGGMIEGAAAGLTTCDIFNPATSSWTTTGAMVQGRQQHAAVLLSDGRVLAVGGAGPAGTATRTAEIYDPTAGTWTAVSSMTNVRSGHAVILLADGRVLAAGGNNGAGPHPTAAEIYDPVGNAWSSAGSLATVHDLYPTMTMLRTGKVLLAGGDTAAGAATAELFDPATSSWTTTGSMANVHFEHQAVMLPDGRVFVAGGRSGPTATAAIFDPGTGTWTATSTMAAARFQHGMVSVAGVPIAFGGFGAAAALSSSEIYDATLNSWRAGPAMNAIRYNALAVALDNGNILVAGGRTGGAGASNTNSSELLVMPQSVITATGLTVVSSISLTATVNLTGAATGYWDVVVRESGSRVGKLSGGFAVAAITGPTGFAGTAQSSSSIQWSWTDNSSTETGFRVMNGAVNLSGDLAANTTTWLQTGLTANATSGALFARAFNSTGTADSGSLTRYSLTDPPNSISTTFFGSSVALTWPVMTNPAGTVWAVDRATDGVGYTQFYLSSAAAAYTDTGLAAASTYFYRIGSVNADAVSSTHANATATVFTGSGIFPTAPSGFAGTAQTTASILWSWTDDSSNETGYRVMAGATNVSGNLAAGTTSWLQSGLGVNTSSGSLLVQAFNSTGTANSGAVTRYSLAAVPGALASSSVGQRAASISWTAGGNPGGSLYALERSTGTGFGLRQSSSALSFVDTTLSPASTYYFRALAYNADLVASAYGSSIAVVTPPVPVFLAVSSITPASAASGASVPVAVVGTGFDGSAALTLERASPGSGVWTTTGSFTQARMLGTLTKLADGRVLLAGGMLEGAAPGLATCDIFNPATGGWTATGAMVQGRQQHAAALLPDGRVLVAGGTGPAGTVTRTAEMFDPASGTWTAVSSMTYIRSGLAMILLADGRVLAAGGWDGATSPTAAEIYDAAANSWSAAGSMATARDLFATMTMLRTGKVLVVGGDTASGAATAELYDPANNTWAATGSMANTHFEHQTVMLPDGRVLAAGGRSGPTATAAVYDPGTGTWTATSTMAAARFQHGMVSVAGVPIAFGGFGASAALSSSEIYDATLNSWRAGPAMNAIRYNALAVALDNGNILVAGGRTGGAGAPNTNTSEILVMPWSAITATGLTVASSTSLTATVNLTGAATGYWDAVVRESGSRAARLTGGFSVAPIPAPSGFAGTAQSTSSILWSWTDNSSTEAGFRVMNGAVNLSGDLAANTTVWLQTGLTPNATSGTLFARAFNSTATADSGSLTRYSLAAVPTGLAASGITASSATISWTGAGTSYQLEASTGLGFAFATLSSGAAASFGSTGLTPASTYYYRVLAYNGDSIATAYASSIAVVTLPPAAPPATPSSFAGAAQTTTSILWTWTDNAATETGFRLLAGTTNVSGNLAANTTSWLQTGLGVNASSGALSVEVFNATGTNIAGPLTVYSLAAAPTGLASSGVAQTSATVTWSAAGNPAGTIFALERSTGGGFSALVSSAAVSYADAGLAAASTYHYRVRALNTDAIATAYSSSITLVTAPTPPPGAPSGFAGAAQSASSILWTWTDDASNEDGFRVVSGTIAVSGNLAANATSWLQSGLGANALTGPYAAQAYNAGGAVDSSTASRTTLAAVPAGLAASGVQITSATVSWSQGTNAAGTTFQLERSTGTGYGQLLSGAATGYFDANLSPAATHFYRVRAINAEAVATAYASSIAVVASPPPAVPGAPGTPAGTALGISSISWTWALASGATNHFLYRAADGVVLATQLSGPFVQTGLAANTAYGLRAAGVNLGGLGPLSAAATVYTWAAVPSGAAAVSIASTSLTASWGLNGNDPSTVAQLQRSTNAVDYSTLTIGAVTVYADADLLGCSTYYYRVRNANAAGVLSAYASFTGVTANTLAAPPAGLTAAANAGGSVSLAWNLSPTEGVTGYRLFWDAGSGTVSYAAPLAVLGSTATAYTTGVLTSSASYTFALRTAHRCGLTDTTGALAMSGAAVAAPAVRAAIKEPDSGRRVNGNSLTILAELTAGTPSDVQQIVFQFKLEASTAWASIDEVYLDHPNPDFSFPYFTHADVTGLAAGSYDLRAVAYDRNGVPDSAPPAVRVVVDHTSPDISESLTAAGEIKKDQVVSNAVTSVVETAGDGATDPAVRVTILAGTVNAATATVSVIANPVITTAAPTGQSFVGSAIKINLSNGQTALNGTAAISLTYPDTVRFPALLQIFYLNEATGQWSRDFASTVNTTSRTVSGNTPHFSTFALLLGTAFATDLNSVQVYPVPFKPNGTNPDEGRPFTTGDANSGILFSNLARGAAIKIYTLTGRLVSSLDNAPITGTVRWDAKNQDGRDVASGAYFAVITATGHKSIVKKLVIIR